MKYLVLTAAVILAACGGGSDSNPELTAADCLNQTPIGLDGDSGCTVTNPVVANSDPDSIQFVIPTGFSSEGGSVLGIWHCAIAGVLEGQYIALWDNPTQLNFLDDQTVVVQDVNTVSSWWYTQNGVSVQWSHIGNTVTYVLNLGNRGGMADEISHCLRELPVSRPSLNPNYRLK